MFTCCEAIWILNYTAPVIALTYLINEDPCVLFSQFLTTLHTKIPISRKKYPSLCLFHPFIRFVLLLHVFFIFFQKISTFHFHSILHDYWFTTIAPHSRLFHPPRLLDRWEYFYTMFDMSNLCPKIVSHESFSDCKW